MDYRVFMLFKHKKSSKFIELLHRSQFFDNESGLHQICDVVDAVLIVISTCHVIAPAEQNEQGKNALCNDFRACGHSWECFPPANFKNYICVELSVWSLNYSGWFSFHEYFLIWWSGWPPMIVSTNSALQSGIRGITYQMYLWFVCSFRKLICFQKFLWYNIIHSFSSRLCLYLSLRALLSS